MQSPECFDFFVFSLSPLELSLIPLTSADWDLGSGVPVKLGTLKSADWDPKWTGDAVCLLLGGSGCRDDGGLPNDS